MSLMVFLRGMLLNEILVIHPKYIFMKFFSHVLHDITEFHEINGIWKEPTLFIIKKPVHVLLYDIFVRYFGMILL